MFLGLWGAMRHAYESPHLRWGSRVCRPPEGSLGLGLHSTILRVRVGVRVRAR